MGHKIRLGPIAVFLTVIAAVLSTMAILAVSTARADTVLAERFARATRIRYELEADGNRFLSAADGVSPDASGNRSLPEGEDVSYGEDGSIVYETEKEGYGLVVRIRADENGGYSIEEWKIYRIWHEEDPMAGLWNGR